MAKYKVLKTFRDKYTKEVYEEGTEIELLVKRGDEVIANLGDDFVERTDNVKKDETPEEKGQNVTYEPDQKE